MVVQAVAVIGITQGRAGFYRGEPVNQGRIVVIQDHHRVVAALQVQFVAHHVNDAIGQQMILPEGIAPLALDIYQGFTICEGIRETLTNSAEIHSHGNLSL